jgi:hypothetical protein
MRWVYLALSLVGAMCMLHYQQSTPVNWIEDVLIALFEICGAAIAAYGFTKWQEMGCK